MRQDARYCAIYTRKSTEDRLDMEFNSLDAQREACLAYITSQKAEGWEPVKMHYNDGGFSGGTLGRPALERLLDDIRAGKIHIVVVYKIDRLTRSLTDFTRLVEVFDEYGVTFVSVTQSFNTTTSMGRLTLNVLLSFAQFEREVAGERIRDKIAASKKKGMWMGGVPPIGYDLTNRKLVINEEDAEVARHLFERYLTLGCVSRLKKELDAKRIRSRIWISENGNRIGGKPFSRGALYSILKNPVYIGCIKHKKKVYDGQHEAIISEELWEAVQAKLKDQSARQNGHLSAKEKNLLKGLLRDCEDTPYSPSYTKKAGKQYRYYVSQNLLQYRDHPKGLTARLPSHDIEALVEKAVRNEIQRLSGEEDGPVLKHILKHQETIPVYDLITFCVKKITIDIRHLTIFLQARRLPELLKKYLDINIDGHTAEFEITVPFKVGRAKRGALIIEPEGEKDIFDLPPDKLKKLVQGAIWRDEHFKGIPLKDIATHENYSQAYVGTAIFLSFEILHSVA